MNRHPGTGTRASTRPRSFERGNKLEREGMSIPIERFNEAAFV